MDLRRLGRSWGALATLWAGLVVMPAVGFGQSCLCGTAADELVAELHTSDAGVSRSTVYRTLRLLVESGLLREFRIANRAVFEHDFGYPSHDHIHCTQCDSIIEFRNEEIRKIRETVARDHGFRADAHRLVIEGVCQGCQKKASRSRRRLDLI